LHRYNAVQLFEHVVDSDREGRLGQRFPGHIHARTSSLKYGRPAHPIGNTGGRPS
jgi:hypothetical protein